MGSAPLNCTESNHPASQTSVAARSISTFFSSFFFVIPSRGDTLRGRRGDGNAEW